MFLQINNRAVYKAQNSYDVLQHAISFMRRFVTEF